MNPLGISRKGKLAWAFEELQILQNTENTEPFDDCTAVRLEVSDAAEALENSLNGLIPMIRNALSSQGYRFIGNREPKPERGDMICASRRLSIIPEHPDRPILPGQFSTGYTHIDLRLGSTVSSLGNYSTISFPDSTEMGLILLLMQNTSGHGCPTTMTCSHDLQGARHFNVTFSSGFGIPNGGEPLRQAVYMRLLQHMRFLDIAAQASLKPSGDPGVHGVIEIINTIASQ